MESNVIGISYRCGATQAVGRERPTLLPAPALTAQRTAQAAKLAALQHLMAEIEASAHLLRAKLFRAEGFGLWNNWWYAGHHTLGYSVLFPAVSAALRPAVVAQAAVLARAQAVRASATRARRAAAPMHTPRTTT